MLSLLYALSQIPDGDGSVLVADDKILLVGMKHDGVDGGLGGEHSLALKISLSAIPDFNGPVLAAGVHPFALLLESHAHHVLHDTLIVHDRIGVVPVNLNHSKRRGGGSYYIFENLPWGFSKNKKLNYLEHTNVLISAGNEELAVGRDVQGVDLAVRMLKGPGALARVGLPKLDGVIVSGCRQDDLFGRRMVKKIRVEVGRGGAHRGAVASDGGAHAVYLTEVVSFF